jgi:hypothetical protein
VEAQHPEAEPYEAPLLARIVLSRGPAGVPFLSVYLDHDAELRVGEVDARDELVAVGHLELGHWLGDSGTPQKLTKARLEDAFRRPFASFLSLEYSPNDPTAGAKDAAEFFPSPPYRGCREPASSEAVVEEFLEAVGVEHHAEIQERSKRTGRGDAVDLGEVARVKVARLVPDDIAAMASAMSQRRHLDNVFFTGDESQKRGR